MPNARPVRGVGVNFPELSALVPNDRLHLSFECNVLANIEMVGHPLEIPQVFMTQAERVGIFEIDAIDMRIGTAWRINPSAWILVFIPSTAHFIVLFDHKVRDAGMLQLNGGVQTSHASANDSHDEVSQILRWWRILPNQSSRPRVQGQLLQPHFQLGSRNVGSSDKPEASRQTLWQSARNVRSTPVAIRPEECGRPGLDHRQIRWV